MWLQRAANRLGRDASAMQLRSQRVATRASSTPTRVHEENAAEEVTLASPTPPKKKPRTVKPAATVLIASTPSSSPDDADADRILYQYPTLVPARLLRRYKRFLSDVVLAQAGDDDDESASVDEAESITIYCPNTGPMIGLLDEPNARVQLSKSDDPKRKYAYTLEMVRVHNGERHVWVGVHSTSANYMVEKAIVSGWFTPQLGAFDVLQREVRFATNSRVDFVLSRHDADGDVIHQKYVEVKSVTLAWPAESGGNRCAVFPDTVSTRASKHVTELMELIESRKRANAKKEQPGAMTKKLVELSGAIIFLVQREDCEAFMPSLIHDAKFAQLCAEAEACGIQLLAYLCRLEPDEHGKRGHVRLLHALPLHANRAKVPLDVEADAKKLLASTKKKATTSKAIKK